MDASKQAVEVAPALFPTVSLELTAGELGLVQRAIRYYIQSEYKSIQEALVRARKTKKANDAKHAEDVRRQSLSHVDAAQALQTKIRERMLSHD